MAVVYALTCSVTGFAYIGITGSKLSKRLREHRCLCKSGKHHAKKLAGDWIKYGEKAFSMIILEENVCYSHRGSYCDAEQKWINHYDRQGKLYNEHARSQGLGAEITRKGFEASKTTIGNRWTPETNEKRRLAQLGKPKGHGAKISATKKLKKLMMI